MISVVTSTVNVIYKYTAKWLVEKENHKYLRDKDRTFMLNMVIFKLINTNITVVWAVNQIVQNGLVDEEGNPREDETPMGYIYGLILSLVASKAVSPLISRHGVRFMKFYVKKWNYFRKIGK